MTGAFSLEAAGMSQALRRACGARRRFDAGRRRQRPRAARRERRRQVDAGQMHHGLLPRRPRARCCSTAARRRCAIRATRRALGLGMVYQHFTLVPSMTVLENLVMARADTPEVIDWRRERERLSSIHRRHAVRRAARHAGARPRRRREAEGGNPQAALSRRALPHPRRADLGADAAGSRRDAGDDARHGAREPADGAADHPQVPRSARLRRRGDGAAQGQARRDRQGRRPHRRQDGGDDDRRGTSRRAGRARRRRARRGAAGGRGSQRPTTPTAPRRCAA